MQLFVRRGGSTCRIRLPSFLGETHYAFLGYAKNFRQTPARREMDYLRQAVGSREGAKELKLFGLGPFFVRRYTEISDALHDQNVSLAKSKLYIGALLTLLGTIGYYGTYAFVIYKTILGALTIGTGLGNARYTNRQVQKSRSK